MLKIMIIDDEIMSVKTLTVMIETYIDGPHTILGETDFDAALQQVRIFKPDLVLLDVVMPPRTGFDFLAQLQPRNFSVIFTTAYDNYAIQAIKYSALDYLLKPIAAEELKLAFKRYKDSTTALNQSDQYQHLLSNLQTKTPQLFTLAIPTLEKTHYVAPADLVRCESESNYTWFYLVNGDKILSSKTLKAYDTILAHEGFIRVHRSHLVNRKHILRIEKDEVLILKNGDSIPLARNKRSPLKASMKEL